MYRTEIGGASSSEKYRTEIGGESSSEKYLTEIGGASSSEKYRTEIEVESSSEKYRTEIEVESSSDSSRDVQQYVPRKRHSTRLTERQKTKILEGLDLLLDRPSKTIRRRIWLFLEELNS